MKTHQWISVLTRKGIILFLICCVLLPALVEAQVSPKNGSKLNFTQVLFEVNDIQAANSYEFKIIQKGGDFKYPLILQNDATPVTIIENLDFGGRYEWKVTAFDSESKVVFESEIFYFQIETSPFVDVKINRFQIIKDEPGEYKNGLIFLDNSRVAINRQGKPVWFLPNLSGVNTGRDRIRDVKLTSAGTVTFMAVKFCREIDLNGNSLWETPKVSIASNDTIENYHHDFLRLNSGNYLAMTSNKRVVDFNIGRLNLKEIRPAVIVEYNQFGDTVWTWDSGSYITDNDILEVGEDFFRGSTVGHMNSIYMNEEKNEVYAGFRDINAVVVVDKKTRQVIRTYGDKIPSDTTLEGKGFFRRQHAALGLTDGKIILFNNNSEEAIDNGNTRVASVQIISEGNMPDKKAAIEWEFLCDFDDVTTGSSARMGNAFPIDTTHFLVNMGITARIFEVNYDKEVTWDCLPQKWKRDSAVWEPVANYRAAFCSSLYPCYFSLSKKSDDQGTPLLSIVNEGSEEDLFNITIVYGKKGKKRLVVKSEFIKSGEKFDYSLVKLSKKLEKNGGSVSVNSHHNNRLTKELIFPKKD